MTKLDKHFEAIPVVQVNGWPVWWDACLFEVVDEENKPIDLLQKREPTFKLESFVFDIETDPFDRVVFNKSRKSGLSEYQKAATELNRTVARSFGIPYSELTHEYDAAQRASAAYRLADLFTRNSCYGKFGAFNSITQSYINPLKDSPMTDTILPDLEIPAAPAPAPSEPESASVQVLRKLLEKLQAELKTWNNNEAESLRVIAELKEELVTAEEELAEARRGITAAETAIGEIEADIARLKGDKVTITAKLTVDASDLSAKTDKASTWTDWFGGKCPLPADTLVEVQFGEGRVGCGLASYYDWKHRNKGAFGDIVAYRVVETKES